MTHNAERFGTSARNVQGREQGPHANKSGGTVLLALGANAAVAVAKIKRRLPRRLSGDVGRGRTFCVGHLQSGVPVYIAAT
jgi:hypothetical protein